MLKYRANLPTWCACTGASSLPGWSSRRIAPVRGYAQLGSCGNGLRQSDPKWVRSFHHQLRKRIALLPSASRRNLTIVAARRSLLNELQSIREEAEAAVALEYESPLSVILYPDPRLRTKNRRITSFDEKLQQLVQEMFDVMYKTDGVGLSAPQVGVNVQLMVYNPEGEKGKGQEYVLVNPKIVKYGKKTEEFVEGCLSFPTIEASIERPLTVRVDAQDIKGKKFSINLKDFQARIFQHEYDHLEGILYFERMRPDILDTIRLDLMNLEAAYERYTGLPSPERISNRK